MVEKLIAAAERAVLSGKVHALTPCRMFGWDGVAERDGCGCLVGAALVDAYGDFRAYRAAEEADPKAHGLYGALERTYGATADEVAGLISGFDAVVGECWTDADADFRAGYYAGKAFRAKYADKVVAEGD